MNHTVVARLLAQGFGGPVGEITAVIAILISLGTANAFVAATSRLGYALARAGAFPPPFARLSSHGVPAVSVTAVGGYAGLGVLISYFAGWDPETLLVAPASLVILTFLAGTAAGMRLLTGGRRALATVGTVLCLLLVPFSGGVFAIPVLVAGLALGYRRWAQRGGTRTATGTTPSGRQPPGRHPAEIPGPATGLDV